MHVVHIGKYFPPVAGGIENFTYDLLQALEGKGVKTTTVVHDDTSSTTQPLFSEKAGKVIRVRSYGQLLYAPVSPGFPLALKKVIDEEKPDILHFHMPNTSALWALLFPSVKKIPWVIHWHSDVVPSAIDSRLSLAYRFYRPFEQKMLANANRIICTSQSYSKSSLPLRKWQDKCQIIPLGLNSDRLQCRQEAKKNSGDDHDFLIVAIGRLTYYKGFDILIQAAAQLKKVRILIVGNGEQQSFLEKKICELGVEDKVTLCGYLPDEELYQLFNSADCLCLPSLERTEAFGLVLLEAMACGVPVVVSDVPGSGMSWVVTTAENGLLFPPGDSQKLIDAITYLMENNKKSRNMAKSGRKVFEERFHIDTIADQIIKTYSQLISYESRRED
jgi:glycosyltransferase involved in cell wall biosynthesis